MLLLSDQLNDEQLDQEFELSHKTVRRTFGHIVSNMEIWSGLMDGQQVFEQDSSPLTIANLIIRLDTAHQRLAKVAAAIRDRNGWDERWIDPFDGKENTDGGSLARILTQSMHHRAQWLDLLRKLEVEPLPEGDVLIWEVNLK